MLGRRGHPFDLDAVSLGKLVGVACEHFGQRRRLDELEAQLLGLHGTS
jgi:hypothetical protein